MLPTLLEVFTHISNLDMSAMLSHFALLAVAILGFNVHCSSNAAPTVTVKNGTYAGLHSDAYNQDFFLGIPFAQPPLGDLRLAFPQSLNQSWQDTRSAVAYYPECVGYGVCTPHKTHNSANLFRVMMLVTMSVKTASPSMSSDHLDTMDRASPSLFGSTEGAM